MAQPNALLLSTDFWSTEDDDDDTLAVPAATLSRASADAAMNTGPVAGAGSAAAAAAGSPSPSPFKVGHKKT